MNEIETRKLFITDEEWARTSSSWKELKPLRNFERFDPNDESVTQFSKRLKTNGYEIPYLVIEQWIYPHYYNRNVVNNYGWIEYKDVEFIETKLPINQLRTINVIEDYQSYVKRRSEYNSINDFTCLPDDKNYWQKYGTWRVPPVIIDVTTFPKTPAFSELLTPLQLIEGHTRFGYLLALDNKKNLTTKEHTVFILKSK